jgi:hypothetical protein
MFKSALRSGDYEHVTGEAALQQTLVTTNPLKPNESMDERSRYKASLL